MKRKLALTAAIWGATVLLMALQKPIFLLYYASEAAAHSAAELWQVVWQPTPGSVQTFWRQPISWVRKCLCPL